MGKGTEHVSLESGTHPDEWRDGATCDDCQRLLARRREQLRGEQAYWNINWLQQSNAMGETAIQMRQEMYDEAKRTGKDMRHVGESATARMERNQYHGTGSVVRDAENG